MTARTRRRAAHATLAVIGALTLSSCAAGSFGSSDSGGDGGIQISFLAYNDANNVLTAEAVIAAFEAANPEYDVRLDTRPGGGDGDNLVKTRLSTGDMAEVFQYNSGSLFQAIAPVTNLVPVTDQPWVADLDQTFREVVSAETQVYGSPWGNTTGGGIFYNKPIYDRLGLEIPTTWEAFMANNEKIKAAGGITPVQQTFGDTWTAQIFVLADYHNVAVANPDFADEYTANQAKYATTPAALAGFEHLQAVHDAGYLNEDFASAKYNDGLAAVANGAAAHYPMITFGIPGIEGVAPDQIDDVGFFALPGGDAAEVGATLWSPDGVYIPKTAEGDKLAAAKAFQAFLATPEGCAAQAEAATVGGPFAVTTCELPADVPAAVSELAAYVEDGNVTPALEFLSPIKGPALEQIMVEVGSGIRGAADGAALYDQDVQKQAQQLGIEGW